ncbi:ATP-dependent endonuclease [Alistipes senegalensis]|uniref:ATP-dependent endonuclease n=1 Tax=Alistipes senegalensis TaxID=1288121 RepID=UPI00101D51E2|nr:ATP-dependent endonuclease [Alistipes senegalensis]
MKLSQVKIRNFRKLSDCTIDFDDTQTIFVGANNSGKTTAMSALRWFLDEPNRFTAQDFTVTLWKSINDIGDKWLDVSNDEEIHIEDWFNIVPSMDVWVKIDSSEKYRVINLLPSLTWNGEKVGARLRFQPKEVKNLYAAYIMAKRNVNAIKEKHGNESIDIYPKNLTDFISHRNNLQTYFELVCYLLDEEQDISEYKESVYEIENPFKKLIKINCIEALREFSDPDGNGDNIIDTLSRQLQEYYKKQVDPRENIRENDYSLLKAIDETNKVFDENLMKSFASIIDELEGFNYPGFQNPKIEIHSYSNPASSIGHDSAVQFIMPGEEGLRIPEKYNGLGYRNLLSMYFKLIQFRESWLHLSDRRTDGKQEIEPIHLVLIEEPEAHLHAQAQQIFIRKAIDGLTNVQFLKDNSQFSTQLIVSTHSTHISNEVNMCCMRYFKRIQKTKDHIPISKVINMRDTFGEDKETERFVTRYLQLMHYDVFFADAIILIEGAAEKILLPQFVRKMELGSRFVSIIEINGSHAFRFKPLIDRLEILTLIISDIDAKGKYTDEAGKPRSKAELPEVGKNQETSNNTLIDWLPQRKMIDELLTLESDKKENAHVRIAYPCSMKIKYKEDTKEIDVYPYTFEDALIFSNIELFRQEKLGNMGAVTTISNLLKSNADLLSFHKKLFDKLENKKITKAELAINLLFAEQFGNLVAPPYIQEGLRWLKSKLD